MEYSKDIKKKLGLIIESERFKNYQSDKSKWNYKAFISINGIFICDLKTYRKLRKGFVIQDSHVYNHLMSKLNYQIDFSQAIADKLKKMLHQLEHFYIILDLKRFKEKSTTIKEYLKQYAHLQPWNQYYLALLDIEKYVLDQRNLTSDEYNHYLKLYAVFDDPMIDFIKMMLIAYLTNHRLSDEETLKKLQFQETFKCYLVQEYNQYLMQQNQFHEATTNLVQLREVLLKEKNHNRYIVNMLAIEYSLSNYSKVQFDDQLFDYIREHRKLLTNHTLGMYYTIQGIFYYKHKNYQKAFSFLKESLLYKNSNYYYVAIIYMHYINDIEFIEEIQFTLRDNYLSQYKPEITAYVKYFLLKKEYPSSTTLEQCLINEIAPYLAHAEDMDCQYFTKELRACIKKTKHYKLFFVWSEILENHE